MPKKQTKKKVTNQKARSQTTSTTNEDEGGFMDTSVRFRADIYVQLGEHEEEYVAEYYLHKGADPDKLAVLEKTMQQVVEDQVLGPMRLEIRKLRRIHNPKPLGHGDIIPAEIIDAPGDSPMDELNK